MIEKGNISAMQMGIMMYPTILATAVLLVPAITTEHAERDMWLSPLWASLIGFLTVYIACQLNRLYPKDTIIQYSGTIIGWFPGKVIGFIFIFFYLQINGIVIREYAEFVVGIFLLRTPIVLVLASMTLVCAFAVRAGLEVLGRLAEFIVPIWILLFLLIIILLLPDVEAKHMFPILEKGIIPSMKGAAVPQSWLSEFFLISFLLPFLRDREKGMKWGMISVLIVTLTMVATNIVILMLFGQLTSSLTYPVMNAAKYISIADFLEHLESIVMAIWVAGTFVKICVFYYAISLGTAQWLNLSDYRPIVFPLGLLLVLFAIWSGPNLAELSDYFRKTSPFNLPLLQTVIPMFLLLIAYMKKGRRKKMGEQHE
ncbi:spore germination protein [Paenibacillus alginolyticus]|uniref:GerAB/ArcD/ProY family transporter n=1 Tax=Paenibacillus alginolyticus TaxID=59839 RepID=UPI000402B710|nr:endospore germination permease [Paenibacillus alginolyticus]MCY9666762.1 spore germination protein [Paenibacillus alginolyticus]